jgi:hypothetical protein
MNEFENRLLQTTVAYLIEWNYHEIASLLVESELILNYSIQGFDNYLEEVIIDLPISTYNIIEKNDYFKNAITRAINKVSYKNIRDQNSEFSVEFRIKLIDIEEKWKEKVKDLISNFKDSNQGIVTELAFKKEKKTPYIYNEMKFASKSEIKIAMELEQQKVLFFPLPLAVRAETGNKFEDHREVDFLVCQNGIWGILEVAFHPDRFEKDSEKDTWFKKSGILCIQHYTSERCYNSPQKVVLEFLEILQKYKT